MKDAFVDCPSCGNHIIVPTHGWPRLVDDDNSSKYRVDFCCRCCRTEFKLINILAMFMSWEGR